MKTIIPFFMLFCAVSAVNAQKVSKVNSPDYFSDSLRIGRPRLNKIVIEKFSWPDSTYSVIKFYAMQNHKWLLKNKFQYEKDEVRGLEPKLSDFNNDGFNDITYISSTGARGANEIRRLFIYDKIHDALISIKNSEDYPNMLYNGKLNCIDAFLIYGGCSTVFLKIKGDSLKEFASVELFDGLTVTTYSNNGKAHIIQKDPKNKSFLIRYKNFLPLEEYDIYWQPNH